MGVGLGSVREKERQANRKNSTSDRREDEIKRLIFRIVF